MDHLASSSITSSGPTHVCVCVCVCERSLFLFPLFLLFSLKCVSRSQSPYQYITSLWWRVHGSQLSGSRCGGNNLFIKSCYGFDLSPKCVSLTRGLIRSDDSHCESGEKELYNRYVRIEISLYLLRRYYGGNREKDEQILAMTSASFRNSRDVKRCHIQTFL